MIFTATSQQGVLIIFCLHVCLCILILQSFLFTRASHYEYAQLGLTPF